MTGPKTYTEDLKARGLDELVKRYTMLGATIDELETERAEVLDRIRSYGIGQHVSLAGKVIKINPPNRKFNVARAAMILPEEIRGRCVSIAWDPKLIKRELTQDQLDECMEPGTGSARVIIDA